MIDINNKYTTRDGRAVRILCVDAPGDYPVVGYIIDCIGSSDASSWCMDGRCLSDKTETELDLIPAKTKHEGWVNIYHGYCCMHDTKDEADTNANNTRVACVKVEWEE